MKEKKLIAATYAPMHNDGSLNSEIINEYSSFLVRNNVAGVFMNGSTGDFVSLSTEERKKITLGWAKVKSSNLYLIDQVGDPSINVAKELATYASDKVDAIAVLAPFYFRINTLEKLVEYCKEIAECAPNLPFYYYHIPVLSGANFKMFDFLKLAPKVIPNFKGIKFTNNDLIDYLHCKNYNMGKYDILFGFDEIFLSSLPLGADGWVGSTYNHLAPIYHEIRSLFEKGNMADAATLQRKAISFVETLDSYGGFNGVAKGFMKYYGVDCGPSRFPHSTINNEIYENVKKEMDNLGLIQYLCK
ncbi:dihydrodipicolinate synthase family protein [Joostella sp.]|uniref:dihydrodipicolinate synthase family protein n=1 Tax=Joostella sp. TaxID=2231138 RepID=UPI003A94B798